MTYEALDEGVQKFVDTLAKNCPAPEKLELKVDAQVILLKNLSVGKLVNGSRYGSHFKCWGRA
jgi:hypothetical protein